MAENANKIFFDLLNEQLLNDKIKSTAEEISNGDNVERCLISDLPLEDDYVELECGHKFNYGSIYNDIYERKYGSSMKYDSIKKNQIRCPYCRNVQNKLLPINIKFDPIPKIVEKPKPKPKPKNCQICVAILKNGKQCKYKAKYGKYCGIHCKIYNKNKES
jgi:hypothetical protein